ncbi:5'-nucleotidase [Seminavis robusta]|uniref:5'-nucleotidase n=1 Tax=Seminavis robusta TaxID=568900 RepID=A0A9N8E7T0_9STRA|nr:5'-nucleotidase [Seminavis robusta]|eukprot:Sro636_g179320.1 5'-nucleotidase (701) ;mRNA; f:35513-37701
MIPKPLCGTGSLLLLLLLLASGCSCGRASVQTNTANLQMSPDMTRRLTRKSRKKESKFTCPDSLGLPLGDINLLVVTDIHGWIAGQHARHEPEMNLDFGALVSLYERLQECAPEEDFFLFFNGDFMDGTGLSAVPPEHLAPLLAEMPFSAVNVGNHELYFTEVVDYMMEKNGFVDHWKGNYLASNVDYIVPHQKKKNKKGDIKTVPLGNRYTFLHGANRNSTILTLGFLYNFLNNCNNTQVQFVEETLQEDWFHQVLTQSTFDAVIVMAHMDAVDSLVYTILSAIRALVGPDMPIHFLTGHTHRRHYEVLDPLAVSLEAGRYMDTIGFASLPMKQTQKSNAIDANLYQYRMLNTNLEELATTVLKSNADFSTHRGRALTKEMQHLQEKLGLLDVVTHCAPQDYHLEKAPDDETSLWWLYTQQVVPKTLLRMVQKEDGITPIFMQGTGALRYSLFAPVVVVDDIVAVSPFDNPVWQIGCSLTAQQLNQVFVVLQVDEPSGYWDLLNFGVAGDRPDPTSVDSTKRFDLYTTEFEIGRVMGGVQSALEATGETDVDGCFEGNRPVYPASGSRMPYLIHHKRHNGEPLDTADFWFEFIAHEWRCPANSPTDKAEKHGETKQWLMAVSSPSGKEPISFEIATMAAAFLVILYAFASVRKQNVMSRRSGDGTVQLVDTRRTSRGRGEATPLLELQADDKDSTSYSL